MDTVFAGVLYPKDATKDQDIVVKETDLVPIGGGEKISEVEVRPPIKDKELYQENQKDSSLNDNTPFKDNNILRNVSNDGISMVELMSLQGNTLTFS